LLIIYLDSVFDFKQTLDKYEVLLFNTESIKFVEKIDAGSKQVLRNNNSLILHEHNPPHFHAKYGEYKAEIDIQTLRIINGELPKRAKSLVLEWADEHRDELMNNWELARMMKELKSIEPLK